MGEPEVPQSQRAIPDGREMLPVRVALTPRLLATFRLEGCNSATSGNTGEMLTERSSRANQVIREPERVKQ